MARFGDGRLLWREERLQGRAYIYTWRINTGPEFCINNISSLLSRLL